MKSNSWLPWVLVVILVVALGWSLDSCRHARTKLDQAEGRYKTLVAQTDAARAESDRLLAEYTARASAALGKAEEARAKAVALGRQVSDLTAALHAAQEPPTTAEQEALPIVIWLRSQLALQEQRFTLVQQQLSEKDNEIASLRVVISAKDNALAEWQAKYEREHVLRLEGEALYAESKSYISKLERRSKASTVVFILAAGAITYAVVK